MKIAESVLYGLSFAFVALGVGMELHRLRRLEHVFDEVRDELSASAEYGIESVNEGARTGTGVSWQAWEMKIRAALERLASPQAHTSRRIGSAAAVVGGLCALAASLLAVWR